MCNIFGLKYVFGLSVCHNGGTMCYPLGLIILSMIPQVDKIAEAAKSASMNARSSSVGARTGVQVLNQSNVLTNQSNLLTNQVILFPGSILTWVLLGRQQD